MTNPLRLTVYLISAIVIVSIIAWSFMVGVLYGRYQSNINDQNDSANTTKSNPSGLTLTGTIASINGDQLTINYDQTLISPTTIMPAGSRVVTINDQTEIIIQTATMAEVGIRKQADFLTSLAKSSSAKTSNTPPPAASTTADRAGSVSDLQAGAKIRIIIDETDGKSLARRITILK